MTSNKDTKYILNQQLIWMATYQIKPELRKEVILRNTSHNYFLDLRSTSYIESVTSKIYTN